MTTFFTTRPQAIDFSERLSEVSGEMYKTDFDLETCLQEKLGARKKDKFMALLRENRIPVNSNSALSKFIEQIKKNITDMPEVSITIAIEPQQGVLNSISDWFMLNLQQQVLLDIQTDPEIIAGAVVNYQGNHIDASVKPVFNKICSDKLSKATREKVEAQPDGLQAGISMPEDGHQQFKVI